MKNKGFTLTELLIVVAIIGIIISISTLIFSRRGHINKTVNSFSKQGLKSFVTRIWEGDPNYKGN